MRIIKIEVENFRLLKNFSMDLEEDLSLVIGKNNTGKTSILSVLDKFLNEKSKFSYDDFNIGFKNELEALIKSRDIPEEFTPKGIKLKIFIEYNEKDDLSNVSRVLMDLDPNNNKIVLGFEYTVNHTGFLKMKTDYAAFEANEKAKVDAKKKNKTSDIKEFLKQGLDNYFHTHKMSFEYDMATNKVNEVNFIDVESEGIAIKDIIGFKYISARRDVTNKEKENTLSKQTSSLYKKQENNSEKKQATENFKDQLSETDSTLSGIYKDLFSDVIKKVQDFGGVKLNDTDIEIISTLQHRELLEGNTTVVYTHDDHKLPEHYNGLGYMNLISMIFEIEILVQDFKRDKDQRPADINLLIIEEPEAHTHPQMQYVFIKNIKKLLAEGIKRDDGIKRPLQYIITTHSSHIVADSDFDDIKYLKSENKNNVVAKNISDLRLQYDADPSQYQFLKQYLTISRAEIFFADKAVLIEGDTERILIPTFMRKADLEEAARLKIEGKDDTFLPLLSQNISIIEVGAYSQIFEKFIDFLGIKSLILTDIDSIKVVKKDGNGQDVWGACPVNEGTKTSNSAINHFLKDVAWDKLKTLPVGNRTILVGSSTVCICYQQEENAYHARSFEDAFIHINRSFVNGKKDEFQGLQNRKLFDEAANDAYSLADSCIKKKTHFALDILYHSDNNFSNWDIPAYVKKWFIMVEGRLSLEPEVQEILRSIDNGRNFLLSGGAGSGKTYSLVSVIRQVIAEYPTAKVACMTYTNAAVKEIEERVNHKNLNVSTIHDFLWDNIKHFQKELKEAIISLANNEEVSKISIEDIHPIPCTYFDLLPDGIQYMEFLRLREGIISHDELLIVAHYLFEKYSKLSNIVKDKFKFIFIDEYQDTSKAVIETFLTHFKKSKRKNVIGFFGDAMQSIYEEGIGNLDEYKGASSDTVNEIPKKQNRRNPQLIIDLANKLRTDGITQEPSSDPKAPNMLEGIVKQGTVLFLHSTDGDITKVEKFLRENYSWDFQNSKETKELNLTHNLIAGKAGFRTLMDIYDDDPIIGLKSDIVERIKYNKKNDKPEIEINEDDTFDNVVDKFQLKNKQKQLKKDIILNDPFKAGLYNQLKDKPFSEIRKIYLTKDALIDDKKQDENDKNKKGSKRDNLIKHLFKIQTNISLYQNRRYNEFLKATDYRFRIVNVASKKALKENIESLINVGEKAIEEVINDANEKGICLIDDKLIDFKAKKEYLYNRVKDVRFTEFQKLYEYLEGKTPFSTQHKTKGAEFNNVLVVLDNGNWNDYNFNYLFDKENIYQQLIDGKSKTKSKLESFPRVLNRTQKIFYVCCTRAKGNLAVFFHNPDRQIIAKAKEWFGIANVIDIANE